MKYKLTLLLLLWGNLLCFSQKMSKYLDCYIGRVAKIQTYLNLYTYYDYKNGRLQGKLEGLETSFPAYLNQEYIIKEIITGISKQDDGIVFCEKDACIVVLESKESDKLLYYYSICGLFPNGISFANHKCTFYKLENFECDQYEEDFRTEQRNKIRYKEDFFTGLKMYDTDKLYVDVKTGNIIFAAKVYSDSIPLYAITMLFKSTDIHKNLQGCYVVFDDGSRFMRPSADISFDYNPDHMIFEPPYTYETTMYMTQPEFQEFCDKEIRAIRVGGIDVTAISPESKKTIRTRFQALLEASF